LVGTYDLIRYIQWLFPVFEGTGTNSMASALTKAEARLIRTDLTAAFRFIQNYKYEIIPLALN